MREEMQATIRRQVLPFGSVKSIVEPRLPVTKKNTFFLFKPNEGSDLGFGVVKDAVAQGFRCESAKHSCC